MCRLHRCAQRRQRHAQVRHLVHKARRAQSTQGHQAPATQVGRCTVVPWCTKHPGKGTHGFSRRHPTGKGTQTCDSSASRWKQRSHIRFRDKRSPSSDAPQLKGGRKCTRGCLVRRLRKSLAFRFEGLQLRLERATAGRVQEGVGHDWRREDEGRLRGTHLWTARPAYLNSKAETRDTPIPAKVGNPKRRGANPNHTWSTWKPDDSATLQ